MTRSLVTGGSGFIGTNLVQLLSARGHTVQSLDTVEPRNPAHRSLWVKGDLLDRQGLADALQRFQPEYVYHLGARTDLDGAAIADYPANTEGVSNLVAAIESVESVDRVIFASSRLVCKIGYQPQADVDYCPTTAYGESKVEGERIVRAQCGKARFSWVILRPTSIWGPWFDVPYKTFFLSVARGRYVHPAGHGIEKSFGYVGNTVRQLLQVAEVAAGRVHAKTFYLADYPPIDVAEFATSIQRATGARPVMHVPLALLRATAKVGDMLKSLGFASPPITTFRLANLLTPMVHDLRTLEALCGPLQDGLDAGVEETVKWLRSTRQIE